MFVNNIIQCWVSQILWYRTRNFQFFVYFVNLLSIKATKPFALQLLFQALQTIWCDVNEREWSETDRRSLANFRIMVYDQGLFELLPQEHWNGESATAKRYLRRFLVIMLLSIHGKTKKMEEETSVEPQNELGSTLCGRQFPFPARLIGKSGWPYVSPSP